MMRAVAWLVVVCLASTAGAVAQEAKPSDRPAEAPSLTGTWVMLLQGHQVGLEIEQKDTVLTGTLHVMGQRVPLDGDVIDRAFTLASEAQVGEPNAHTTLPLKITGTHEPDDTLDGEIELPRGPMKWTAERLKQP